MGGLLAAGWADAQELAVVEVSGGRRDELVSLHPGIAVVGEIAALATPVDGAVIAVKPHDVPAVAAELGSCGAKRLLSIAAGVTLANIQAPLTGNIPVIRAMPNTPALVGAGAAAIAPGAHADEQDMAWAEEILGAVGVVVRVKESLLDAVTGLSGSGPAYVFLVAEALVEAGVSAGLPREVSEKLAVTTLSGSARMLAESGLTAAVLRGNVTSPGGTTAAGLRVLEQAGVRAAFIDAVHAAADRSRELGQS